MNIQNVTSAGVIDELCEPVCSYTNINSIIHSSLLNLAPPENRRPLISVVDLAVIGRWLVLLLLSRGFRQVRRQTRFHTLDDLLQAGYFLGLRLLWRETKQHDKSRLHRKCRKTSSFTAA
jgi:hypothetical protein